MADVMGQVAPPAPMGELAARRWDAIVVGGGHNGMTAAAYLAKAGRSVLVLERRDRLGGACTMEQPFDDPRWKVSPCAYLVGLLDPTVIAELELPRRGYRVHLADPAAWCPFDDGTSFTEWKDDGRTAQEVERLAPGELDGFFAYQNVYRRIRARLRAQGRDAWQGESPTRAELSERLADDPEALEVLFELSVADLLDRYVRDQRLKTALHGAGVIGTFAGPRDPGTAAVRLMHNMGLIGGWGYVEGGMGRVSFAIADAAIEAGALLAVGVPVGAIRPGEGVELEDGTFLAADVIISSADPKRTLALLGDAAPPDYTRRLEDWSVDSPVVKVNAGLSRLPRFTARDAGPHVYRSMVTIATGVDATQAGCQAARRGEVDPAWCELYFQTAYDPSVAPPGKQTMSVFAQYAPYTLATGTWEDRRDEIGRRVLDAIARFAPDVHDCVEQVEVLGPPDIEARIGLSGGHIFQGSVLPDQMWDRRLSARTPVPGLYLCGAATHPGGSVIGLNGRNAAQAVLEDIRVTAP